MSFSKMDKILPGSMESHPIQQVSSQSTPDRQKNILQTLSLGVSMQESVPLNRFFFEKFIQ